MIPNVAKTCLILLTGVLATVLAARLRLFIPMRPLDQLGGVAYDTDVCLQAAQAPVIPTQSCFTGLLDQADCAATETQSARGRGADSGLHMMARPLCHLNHDLSGAIRVLLHDIPGHPCRTPCRPKPVLAAPEKMNRCILWIDIGGHGLNQRQTTVTITARQLP